MKDVAKFAGDGTVAARVPSLLRQPLVRPVYPRTISSARRASYGAVCGLQNKDDAASAHGTE